MAKYPSKRPSTPEPRTATAAELTPPATPGDRDKAREPVSPKKRKRSVDDTDDELGNAGSDGEVDFDKIDEKDGHIVTPSNFIPRRSPRKCRKIKMVTYRIESDSEDEDEYFSDTEDEGEEEEGTYGEGESETEFESAEEGRGEEAMEEEGDKEMEFGKDNEDLPDEKANEPEV